jgi:hypothetical protein
MPFNGVMRNLAMVFGLAMIGSLPLAAVEAGKLELMAKSASTPAEHVEVAKLYRHRANDLTAQADRHEAKAKELDSRRTPMASKWPAMSNQSWVKERQLAVQARRQASEARQAADLHLRYSVEGLVAASAQSKGSGDGR